MVEQYDILFQVFRPSSDGEGCYDMVGSNFLNDGDPSSVAGGDIDHCLVLTDIPPEDQIQVQPGDVVGFYAIQYRDGEQRDGGIQLEIISTVIVWNTQELTISNPDICPYQIGVDGNLASSSAGAPVITAQVGKLYKIVDDVFTCSVAVTRYYFPRCGILIPRPEEAMDVQSKDMYLMKTMVPLLNELISCSPTNQGKWCSLLPHTPNLLFHKASSCGIHRQEKMK